MAGNNEKRILAFAKIDGIEGSATQKGYEKQIELIKYKNGVSQEVNFSASRGGAHTTGGAKHGTFDIWAKLDDAATGLWDACNKATHIKKIDITQCAATGDKLVEVMKYSLEGVVVSKVDFSADVDGDGVPDVSASLTYDKMQVTFKATDKEGKEKGQKVASYSRAAGAAA